jgi:hypothetical protein
MGGRVLSFAVAVAVACFVTQPTEAIEPPITVGEVSAPPPSAGLDVAALRDAAEGEVRQIDASTLPDRRRFVVSLALTRAAAEGPVTCTINAMIRDAKTGAMIAIIEAGAHAEGPVSSELRKQVAHAAVRSAVQKIPRALGAK